MAHTSEQRDHLSTPLCDAKKKNGQLCRAFAGQSTEHPGVGRCKYHGGNTPTHKQNAVTVAAQRQMVTLGAALDVAPHEALLGVLRATAGHVAWLAHEVGNLEALADPDARVVTALYAEERDRLARVAKACLDTGISEVEVRITQRYTEALSKAIEASIKAVDGLTSEQRRQFGAVLRLELQQLQASAAEPGTKRPAELGQATGPEDHERDDCNDCQLERADVAHNAILAQALPRNSSPRPLRSGAHVGKQ